jgi:hypothetical protein
MFHDPMEEPTKETLVDEHRDAVYSIEEWKCKSLERKISMLLANFLEDDYRFVSIK